jgi:hypothetical protein
LFLFLGFLLHLLVHFEFFEGGAFIDIFLVVQAHLLVGFPEVKEPRLALDESSDEASSQFFVLVAECDVDFSERSGYPGCVGEDYRFVMLEEPVLVTLLSEDKIGKDLLENLLFEELSRFEVLLAHVGIRSFPLFEVGLQIGLGSDKLVILLALIQNSLQLNNRLVSLFQLLLIVQFK